MIITFELFDGIKLMLVTAGFVLFAYTTSIGVHEWWMKKTGGSWGRYYARTKKTGREGHAYRH